MTNTPLLYGISPETESVTQLTNLLTNATRAGLHWLQYRDKLRPKREQIAIATDLKAICDAHRTKLIINDHVDVCIAANADGVHLGQSDGSVIEAREKLGPEAIIGVTCHQSPTLVEASQSAGSTYSALGACFTSTTKPQAATATLEQIQSISQSSTQPLVLIGGITRENVQSLLPFKPYALAVSAGIFASKNVAEQVRHWCSLLSSENLAI